MHILIKTKDKEILKNIYFNIMRNKGFKCLRKCNMYYLKCPRWNLIQHYYLSKIEKCL